MAQLEGGERKSDWSNQNYIVYTLQSNWLIAIHSNLKTVQVKKKFCWHSKEHTYLFHC